MAAQCDAIVEWGIPDPSKLARLRGITQPTLVLAGRHDRVCPVEAAELMAAKILHAELVVFEQSGHMMFVEEPDRYVEVVDEFLRRHR